jgi:hypothetical protein
MRSGLTTLAVTLVSLALAAPALASDKGGEGLYGKTNDKVITNFGFGLMIFFVLLVAVLTLIQSWLERRKHR